MKLIHSLLLTVGLMSATAALHAQATFKMPANMSLVTAADCKAHNADFFARHRIPAGGPAGRA